MDTSILNNIKKLLGLSEDYEAFDMDIIILINTAFSLLHQLGVGPEEGFRIEDASATWSDFDGDPAILEMAKTYVYLKVRVVFDPPTGGVLDAMNKLIQEYEWRLNVEVDPKQEGGE